MDPIDELDLARQQCGAWDDEEKECMEDYPEGCPYASQCKEDAESDTEEEECSDESDG